MKYLVRIGVILATGLCAGALMFGVVSMTTGQSGGTFREPRAGAGNAGQRGGRESGVNGFSAFGLVEVVATFVEISVIAAVGVVLIRVIKKGGLSTDVTLVHDREINGTQPVQPGQ